MRKLVVAAAAAIVVVAGFAAAPSLAQTFDSSTVNDAVAGADVIAPIVLTKGTALNFGQVVAEAVATGTVTIGTDGSRTNTGIKLGATMLSHTGDFTVAGGPSSTYTVTVPATDQSITCTTAATCNTKTMVVNAFHHKCAQGAPEQDAACTLTGGGTDSFKVGATLVVGTLTDNPLGNYSGTYAVTVTYN